MGATSLAQFGDAFAAAYRTRDAEVVADMYEDNAIFESKPRNAGSRDDARDPYQRCHAHVP